MLRFCENCKKMHPRGFFVFCLLFLRQMGKNIAYAHHTSTYNCVVCRFNSVVVNNGTAVAYSSVSTSTRPDPPAVESGAVEIATRREKLCGYCGTCAKLTH